MMFPKPEKKPKERKPYNSLQRKKERKPISELKQQSLVHIKRPNRAGRAEFTPTVVKEAIERSGGICEYCRKHPCTSTHHVKGRGGRDGRGVLTNAFRVCGQCHIDIESSEEKKQEIISLYAELYGPHFWFDASDWEEYERKQTAARIEDAEKRARAERLAPILSLLSSATGRALRKSEKRLIEAMDERELATFTGLMEQMIEALRPDQENGYGRFED